MITDLIGVMLPYLVRYVTNFSSWQEPITLICYCMIFLFWEVHCDLNNDTLYLFDTAVFFYLSNIGNSPLVSAGTNNETLNWVGARGKSIFGKS